MAETRAKKHLAKHYPNAHWQRIESWTSPGIFDTNMCVEGIENWIESKELIIPKTMRGKYRCKHKQPQQIAWEFLRRRAGGRTWVAAMVGEQCYLLPGYCLKELMDGVTLEWLTAKRRSVKELRE